MNVTYEEFEEALKQYISTSPYSQSELEAMADLYRAIVKPEPLITLDIERREMWERIARESERRIYEKRKISKGFSFR